ncbi:SCO1860 family LAETG-anchored protein [Kitasatospora sp. McL0602]|uniref:SCO1860 family LAETG-anchored protein n=1 Tax=Kitasatospora sp. McL0602 TaxID=3439530 RepID=UPI003F8C7BA9
MSVPRTALAAALAATALTLPSTAAHATAETGQTGRTGRASAVTAELALRVSLLDKAVDVPVDIALNKVESPAQHSGALLTAKVAGVDQQGPVTLVQAKVGTSSTHADASGSGASVTLADADVHAPGLPVTTLIGLEALSAEVSCPVDGQPTAKVTAPARLTVLGRSVTLGLNGPTHVAVPGIGSVDVEFSRRTTTSGTAAATALDIQVDVNPLKLNVAKVTGRITIASVACEKPVPAPAATAPTPPAVSAAPSTAAARPVTTAVTPVLASTGASGTLTLLGSAAGLLAAGAVALRVTRRRARHR